MMELLPARAGIVAVALLLAFPVALRAQAETPRAAQPAKPSGQETQRARKFMADVLAKQFRGGQLTKEEEAMAKRLQPLFDELVPKEPAETYRRRQDEFLLNLMREFHPNLLRGIEEAFRRRDLESAENILSALREALQRYEMEAGRFPTTEQGLRALLGKGLDRGFPLTDPWGYPYVYRAPGRSPGKPYDLFSVGPDGKEGTADDVSLD
jgi:general secretion pathway protein G